MPRDALRIKHIVPCNWCHRGNRWHATRLSRRKGDILAVALPRVRIGNSNAILPQQGQEWTPWAARQTPWPPPGDELAAI
jgi:hypothetical protein